METVEQFNILTPTVLTDRLRLGRQEEEGMFKKTVQQGRRDFGARSVHGVREHDKGPRTPLAAFFNIPNGVHG